MRMMILLSLVLGMQACRNKDAELKDVMMVGKSGAMLFYREGSDIKIKACKEPVAVQNTTTPGGACELKPGTDIQIVSAEDFKQDLIQGLTLSVNSDSQVKDSVEKLGKEEIARSKEQKAREKAAEKENLNQDILRIRQMIEAYKEKKNYTMRAEEIERTLSYLDKLEKNPNPVEKDLDPINAVVLKLVDEMVSKPGLFIVNSNGDSALFHSLLESYITKEWVKASPASNPYGMEFVTIQAGSFLMGSPDTEAQRYIDEKQHPVTITKSFEMGKYEVTQGQWKAVMGNGNNPSSFKDSDDLPVETVSWNEVQTFIQKLNEGTSKCGDTSTEEGFKKAFSTSGCYRLPTEAEWEYAARAGTKTPFYTGDNITTDQANFDGRYPFNRAEDPEGKYRRKTVSVKDTKELNAANPWGLMHMSGNVWEWNQDVYGDYDLKVKEDPMGALSGEFRVIRGGSWSFPVELMRSASRDGRGTGSRTVSVGFRVVRTK